MKVAAAEALAAPRPRGRARRGRRRLPGAPPEIRPRLHHPGAVRPAPDQRDPGGGGQGGDGIPAWRGSRSSTCSAYKLSAVGAARPDRRRRCSASTSGCRRAPKRVVFAEGEEEQTIRAAVSFVQHKLGTAVLIGREETIRETADRAGIDMPRGHRDPQRAALAAELDYADFLYARLQRQGLPVPRLPAHGQQRPQRISAPAWWRSATPTRWSPASPATTRPSLEDVRRAIDAKPGHRVIGVSIVLARGRTVLVADTAVHEMPIAEELADIAEEAAGVAKRLGYEPARRLPRLFDLRPARGRARAEGARGDPDPRRPAPASTSSTTARWRPTSRLNPAAMAALSLLPPVRAGQRAGHARLPLGLDLDQAPPGARRLDGDRPAAGRARQAGADRLARRQGFRHRQHGGARGVRLGGIGVDFSATIPYIRSVYTKECSRQRQRYFSPATVRPYGFRRSFGSAPTRLRYTGGATRSSFARRRAGSSGRLS